MDVAALVIAVVSLGFAGWAAWAAHRQASAARDAAAEARRSSDAAVAAEARADAIHARARCAWRIESVGVGAYVLRNTGWSDAKNVTIESNIIVALSGDATSVDLAAGQGVAFVAMLTDAAQRGTDVTIRWQPAGEQQIREWVEPFPTLPPTPETFDAHIRRSARP